MQKRRLQWKQLSFSVFAARMPELQVTPRNVFPKNSENCKVVPSLLPSKCNKNDIAVHPSLKSYHLRISKEKVDSPHRYSLAERSGLSIVLSMCGLG